MLQNLLLHGFWNKVDEFAADEFCSCPFEIAAIGVVDKRQGRVGQVAANQFRLVFDYVAISLFTLAPRFRGLLAFGNVDQQALHRHALASLIVSGSTPALYPTDVSIRQEDAIFRLIV